MRLVSLQEAGFSCILKDLNTDGRWGEKTKQSKTTMMTTEAVSCIRVQGLPGHSELSGLPGARRKQAGKQVVVGCVRALNLQLMRPCIIQEQLRATEGSERTS